MRGATIPDTTVISKWTAFQSTPPVRGATVFPAAGARASIDFNPHSPCGERPDPPQQSPRCQSFQSTLPVRGATRLKGGARRSNINFNPHSPCGERLPALYTHHLPPIFQSTLPVRGATLSRFSWLSPNEISIHAPRAGSDINLISERHGDMTISIHAPRAGSDSGRPKDTYMLY